MKNWAWVWGNATLSCSKALHRDRMLMECPGKSRQSCLP